MIIVRLCGGLGNQLFQYATARRLAAVRGAELVLDTSWYDRMPASDTPRQYELGGYPVHGRLPTAVESTILRLYNGRFVRRLPLPRPWRQYRERAYRFDDAVLGLPDGVYLDGYWQSPKYFQDIAALLRRELSPRADAGEDDKAVAALIERTAAVSVHVRRGDYVTLAAAAKMHGTCSIDYYRRALDWIASRVESPHFFVFSDDAQWARANLSFPGAATFVDHNGPGTAFQDLRLMAACRHHIVANSSFSWWGAWLAGGDDRIVVAPKRWFATEVDTSDLIPGDWVRI